MASQRWPIYSLSNKIKEGVKPVLPRKCNPDPTRIGYLSDSANRQSIRLGSPDADRASELPSDWSVSPSDELRLITKPGGNRRKADRREEARVARRRRNKDLLWCSAGQDEEGALAARAPTVIRSFPPSSQRHLSSRATSRLLLRLNLLSSTLPGLRRTLWDYCLSAFAATVLLSWTMVGRWEALSALLANDTVGPFPSVVLANETSGRGNV